MLDACLIVFLEETVIIKFVFRKDTSVARIQFKDTKHNDFALKRQNYMISVIPKLVTVHTIKQ